MTAEVAILNRQAVALAADSAVTVRSGNNQKVFSSANKIFSLSKNRPVGIMIYGNAELMNVPWETIIKGYRSQLKDKSFKKLSGYATNFINYLKKGSSLFPEEDQKRYLLAKTYGYYKKIVDEFIDSIEELSESESEISSSYIQRILTNKIDNNLSIWKDAEAIIDDIEIFREKFIAKYKKEINQIIKDVFERFPISRINKQKLFDIATFLCMKYQILFTLV